MPLNASADYLPAISTAEYLEFRVETTRMYRPGSAAGGSERRQSDALFSSFTLRMSRDLRLAAWFLWIEPCGRGLVDPLDREPEDLGGVLGALLGGLKGALGPGAHLGSHGLVAQAPPSRSGGCALSGCGCLPRFPRACVMCRASDRRPVAAERR